MSAKSCTFKLNKTPQLEEVLELRRFSADPHQSILASVPTLTAPLRIKILCCEADVFDISDSIILPFQQGSKKVEQACSPRCVDCL